MRFPPPFSFAIPPGCIALALLPLLLLSCAPSATVLPPALLAGRLTFEGKGASGVAAALIATGDPLGPAAPPTATALTDAEGRFTLSVPAGTYFLTAASGSFSGFDGRNPLALPPGRSTTVTLPLVPDPGPPAAADDGQVAGTVLTAGKPLAGALVTAYADALGGLRGPGIASTTTGPDGSFVLDLGPGRYFILARGRRDPGAVGPLGPGDRFGFYARNPVTLTTGRGASLILPTVVIPEHGATVPDDATAIVLSGRVVTRDGTPVAGYRACAFDNAGQLSRPLAFSPETGPDGAFRIELPGPGIWYIGARPRLGGPLSTGETPAWYRDGDPIDIGWGGSLEGIVLILGDPLP